MLVLAKETLAPEIVRFVLEAPQIAVKARPGQFVMVRPNEEGERIPLTIADFDPDRGTITLICQAVGRTTWEMNQIGAGERFADVLGPLGQSFPSPEAGTILCVAGGLGAAPLYPKAKALAASGSRLITLLGAKSREMLILVPEFEAISEKVLFATDDGSRGHRGFVTELMTTILQAESVDQAIVIGPVVMMAAAMKITKPFAIPSFVSLNPLMVDGTGMCGGCRITVNGETKFCCVDGPNFDGHAVDFDEIVKRQSYYREQEAEAYHACRLQGVLQ